MYPFVNPLSKSSLANMVQRWRDTVWPDEFIDIHITSCCECIFIGNAVFDDKHL